MNIQLNELSLPSNATDIRSTRGGVIAMASVLNLTLPAAPVRYLYSGWQSWSLTAWVDTDRPILPMRPWNQQSRVTDPRYVNDPRPNGSWYGAVELPDNHIIFLGSLGLEAHVALEGNILKGWAETGNGEWFMGIGNETEILDQYAELLKERFGCGRVKAAPRIWCSWYSLYTDIHEQQLLKILGDLGPLGKSGNLPFDVFQIDDGWQKGIGEWEPNSKFPSGMDSLAALINETGRKAGLWLAPLLIVPSSKIYRNHRDWLLHDKNGKLVKAGFNWGERLYALDTTHPAVLDWLAALMKKVRSWSYDYAKLDFLYAGALPGKRFRDIPRESAYRNGLKVIRDALGDAYLLTCGAPILPSIGLCDGMRLGPDVGGHFASPRDDDLLMNFATPGVRNVLRTMINRLWLQPLVNTDPDVVYFCRQQNNLTSKQKTLLQDLANICNFKATSDIPAWLTNAERSTLHDFLVNQPEIRKTGGTSYNVGDHGVDFRPYIALPTLPDKFTYLLGALLGGLANVPVIMIVFEKLEYYLQKRMLKNNPV